MHQGRVTPHSLSTSDSWVSANGQDPSQGFQTFGGVIQKPDTDQRDYRVIVLENGLRALLIHDPQADKAAACLTIQVGHLQDPDDVPGLAHFCEHMLSKGSAPFPAPNDLMLFITSNGGVRNASTNPCSACYWFSIAPSLLSEAVSRLAASFHSPLFPASVTAREILAVDSENKKNLQDDDRRLFQLNRSLSAPGHPWLKFGSGNFESLTEAARRKVDQRGLKSDAQEEGVDDGGPVGRETRRRMIEWKENEYCAGRMTFAILGKESLDDLTDLTVREFSLIPNLGVDPRLEIHAYPWTEEQQSCAIFVEAVMDFYRFELIFPIPYQARHFRTRPAHYIAHFLGHEGPGSVCAFLKKQGWLLDIRASPSSWNRGIELFYISGELTEAGYNNHQRVVYTIFNYLSVLKASFPLPAFHFDEMKRMSEIRFRNQEEMQAHSYVVQASAALAAPYPIEWVLNGKSLFREWDPKAVMDVLNCLVPERARVLVLAKNHSNLFVRDNARWKTERWYGTRYNVRRLGQIFVTKLSEPNKNEALFLPMPNPFIPTNLKINRKKAPEPLKSPKCIYHSQLSTLFYKKDDQFLVPKGDVRISLKMRLAYATPRHAVLTSLLVKLVEDSLSEVTYDATLAGLTFSLSSHSKGIDIRVYGYNDKLSVLLDMVLDHLKDLEVVQDLLNVFIEELRRNYNNFRMNKPVEHCWYYSSYLLNPFQWTPEEKILELDGITLDDVQSHKEALLSKLKIEALITGNFEQNEALDILKLIETRLECKGMWAAEYPMHRSLLLPEGANFVYARTVHDPKELNSAIVVYHHFGDIMDQPLRAKLDLLVHIIREPAFTELRTNQQLGYIVSTARWSFTGAMGLRIRIQSQKDPTFLEKQIEAFMMQFGTLLEEMSEEKFTLQKEGLIVKQLEKCKNLADEASDFWNHISSGYYDFTRDESDVDIIRALTKEDVMRAFIYYLHPYSASRRKLAVHMLSQHLTTVLPTPVGIVRIEDFYDFKASMPCSAAATPVPGVLPTINKSLL